MMRMAAIVNGIERPGRRWFQLYRALLHQDRGSAMVELALLMSLVGLPLLLGATELGNMVYASIEISNAAHSAAMYGGISLSLASDNAGMTTAAQQEAPDFSTGLSVSPNLYFVCSSAVGGTQYSTQSDANQACTGGTNHSLPFIKVTTQESLTPLIRVPGLPSTYSMVGVSVMEVAQ